MLFKMLVLFSFLIVLLLLRRLVNIMPSLMACMIRGKESVNLESSVKLSLDRDRITYAMIIPFCLTACRYKMYSPGFLQGLSENAYLGICFGVFFVYMILRFIMNWIFRPKKMPKKVYSAAGKASYSFFIIYTLLILANGEAGNPEITEKNEDYETFVTELNISGGFGA